MTPVVIVIKLIGTDSAESKLECLSLTRFTGLPTHKVGHGKVHSGMVCDYPQMSVNNLSGTNTPAYFSDEEKSFMTMTLGCCLPVPGTNALKLFCPY